MKSTLIVLLVLISTTAHANAMEDTFGAGARIKAMGGAGTAAAGDYAAVYHNPAGLAECDRAHVTLGYGHVAYSAGIETASPDAIGGDSLRPRPAYTLGACGPVAYGLHYGLHMSFASDAPQFLQQRSSASAPEFVQFGKRLEQLSIMGGLGAELPWGLRLGFGFSAMVNSILAMQVDVPVLLEDQEILTAVEWELEPAMSIYAGIQWESPWDLVVGMSYRSAMFHDLDAVAQTRVEVAGVLVDLDLILRATSWFSPHQMAWGATYRLPYGITLMGDLTWYHWSAYPGPFIEADLAEGSATAAAVNLPQAPDLDFTDTVVPRIGAEYAWRDTVFARAGYSYRPRTISAPSGETNVIDTDADFFAAGLGGRWANDTLAIRVDAYATVGRFRTLHVNKRTPQPVLNDYRFGGWVVDAGVDAAVLF